MPMQGLQDVRGPADSLLGGINAGIHALAEQNQQDDIIRRYLQWAQEQQLAQQQQANAASFYGQALGNGYTPGMPLHDASFAYQQGLRQTDQIADEQRKAEAQAQDDLNKRTAMAPFANPGTDFSGITPGTMGPPTPEAQGAVGMPLDLMKQYAGIDPAIEKQLAVGAAQEAGGANKAATYRRLFPELGTEAMNELLRGQGLKHETMPASDQEIADFVNKLPLTPPQKDDVFNEYITTRKMPSATIRQYRAQNYTHANNVAKFAGADTRRTAEKALIGAEAELEAAEKRVSMIQPVDRFDDKGQPKPAYRAAMHDVDFLRKELTRAKTSLVDLKFPTLPMPAPATSQPGPGPGAGMSNDRQSQALKMAQDKLGPNASPEQIYDEANRLLDGGQ